MTDEQLTALAREYAEFAYSAARPLLSPLLRDEDTKARLIEHAIIEAREVIYFLLRRFCLVEKEAVRKEYQQAIEQGKHAHVRCHVESRAKLRLLESLFPEIAKEVENEAS